MCLNCGCGQLDDDHGNRDNITVDDLQRASRATGQDLHQTIDNMERGLDMVESQRFGSGGSSMGRGGSSMGGSSSQGGSIR